MRVAYTKSDMAQAVALAAVIGADAAAEQLGCDPRSIRKWAAKAGHGPELAVEPDAWHNLMNLALARVSAQVASGTMKVRDMAVVAGIAARNVREPVARPVPPTVVEQAVDTFEQWVEATYPGVDVDTALAVLLNDPRMSDNAPEPDDAMANMRLLLADLMTAHGSVEEAWQAQHVEGQARVQAQVEANRALAEAARHAIEQAEIAAVIQQGEQYLRDSKETP